jgi:hypothetical protein
VSHSHEGFATEDVLQKHMRNLKTMWLGPEKKVHPGGEAYISYMVIALHNQGSLQSVSTDMAITLAVPASILQVTMNNPDRVGQ